MQSKEWHKSESNFQTAQQDFSLASDLSFFISLLVDQMSVWKKNGHDKLAHLKVTWWN